MKHVYNKCDGFRIVSENFPCIISIEKVRNGTILAFIGIDTYMLYLYDYRDTDVRIVGVDDI
jgi:hypothetical protein